MEEYPESRYAKDVKRIFQKTSDYLKTGTTEPIANNQ
jgi:outer membrane protein assembly factor BamD (BamD/ComL family)